jgi:hypothetical protein
MSLRYSVRRHLNIVPAVKIEDASSAKPKIKRRSQFRVAHSDLTQLYQRHENVRL